MPNIQFYVKPGQEKDLKAKAKKAKLSVSAYIRKMCGLEKSK